MTTATLMENKWSIKVSQHYKVKGNMHFLTQSEVASVLIQREKAKSDSSAGKGSWDSFVDRLLYYCFSRHCHQQMASLLKGRLTALNYLIIKFCTYVM